MEIASSEDLIRKVFAQHIFQTIFLSITEVDHYLLYLFVHVEPAILLVNPRKHTIDHFSNGNGVLFVDKDAEHSDLTL